MRTSDIRPTLTSYELFNRNPLDLIDGIPVFSTPDRYARNYERIADDHLAAIARGVENPFMDPRLWSSLEEDTRRIVRRHGAEGARVLDVGVGLGRLLAPLSDLERHGIDISIGYLNVARDCGITVACARIEDMPYQDGVFDLAVCCDVFEHVLDLYHCSKQIIRVIRPGGLLILRVPYKEDLSSYLDDSAAYEFVHLRTFDVPSLRLHFEKIMGCRYVEHIFSTPYFNGAGRLRLQMLDDPQRLAELLHGVGPDGHVLSPLRRACGASSEQIAGALYQIRETDSELFDRLAQVLVQPLEVNMVFRIPG